MPLPSLASAFFRYPPAACGAVLLAACCTAAAAAAAPASTLSVADVSVLTGTCANCHGPDGKPPQGSAIPGLRGRPADYLAQRMQAFQAGTAADATVMTRLMKGYDAAQIQALAQWFAAQEAHP